MIYIGVIGWGDYDLLYEVGVLLRDKFVVYVGYFLIVEVDLFFYVI